jgi:hypothetical protein
VTVAQETDADGKVIAAEVQLEAPEDFYVAWSSSKTCGVAAGEGLGKRTSARLYRRSGGQASLRTYDRAGATGGAIDLEQSDLRWNAEKVGQALDYLKKTIDAGLPVYIGVNEAGQRTFRIDPATGRPDPARGLANDGVTDHFLLITGYRTEVQGGGWRLTALSAVDNAAGTGQEGRFPRFTIGTDGRVIKPAGAAGSDLAIDMEYQLTQVWVYEADEPGVRALSAWSP